MEKSIKKGIRFIFSLLLILFSINLSNAMDEAPKHNVEDLTDEALGEIFENLTPDESLNINIVSEKFHRVMCDPHNHILFKNKLKHTSPINVYGICNPSFPTTIKTSIVNALNHFNLENFPLVLRLKVLLVKFTGTQNKEFAKEFVRLYEEKHRPVAFLQVYGIMKSKAEQ